MCWPLGNAGDQRPREEVLRAGDREARGNYYEYLYLLLFKELLLLFLKRSTVPSGASGLPALNPAPGTQTSSAIRPTKKMLGTVPQAKMFKMIGPSKKSEETLHLYC